MADEEAPIIAKAPNPLRFLLPSLLGIGLFLTPIPWEDSQQIIVGILAGALQEGIGEAMPSSLACFSSPRRSARSWVPGLSRPGFSGMKRFARFS